MSEDNTLEIVCSDENIKELENHCFSETRVEVGGFLIGKIEDGKTFVNRIVKAKHTVSKSTQLTFTHKTWDAILDDIKKRNDGNDLVGWYHSHPNFGVFLSDHDQFIQNNFFKEDGRVTIVVDPIRGKKGWFFSKAGKIISLPETDTKLEKLGESSTNAEKNIEMQIVKQKQFVTLPALLITSLIFSLFSFGLGFLASQIQSSNLNGRLDQVEQQISYLGFLLQSVPEPAPEPSTSAKPSAKPSTSAKPSAKPSTSAKPSAKPSTSAKPSAKPSTSAKPSAKPSTSAKPSALPSPTETQSSQTPGN